MLATATKKRVTFQNILFATDFLPAAHAAMPYAAGLARSFEANLYTIYVAEPVNYALPPEAWVGMQTAVEAEKKALRKELNRDFPEITPRILEGEGNVWTAISNAVEKHAIDLVVLGTRGRTGVGKLLLGSKAEEILRRAPCPVLTVGPDVPYETGLCGKIASIVYATDFGPASLKASRIAVSLAEEYQSKLTLLNVLSHRESHRSQPQEEFGEARERQLRELVPDEATLWCSPHFAVEHGNPAEKILEVADREKAGLIVLGAHPQEGAAGAFTHFPMATIHKVVAHANCPVLTIRG
jgi:nucleotide-binding universal stress UspA family protein